MRSHLVPCSHPKGAENKLALSRQRPTIYPDPIHRHPTGHPVPMWQQRSSTATKKARKKKQKKNELAYELVSNPERHEQQGGCRYRPRGHIIKLAKDAYFLTRNPIFSGKQPFSAFPISPPISSHSKKKWRHFGAGQYSIRSGLWAVIFSNFQSFSLYIDSTCSSLYRITELLSRIQQYRYRNRGIYYHDF